MINVPESVPSSEALVTALGSTPMNILVVDANDLPSLKIIRCLSKDSAIRSFALGKEKRAPAGRSRYCSGYFSLKRASQGDLWFEQVSNIAKECKIDLLMAATEEGVGDLIEYREKFAQSELRVMDLGSDESFQCATDKWLFYERLCEFDIPQPLTVPLEKALEAHDFWASVASSGAVLKRRHGYGGLSARHISKPDELESYLKSTEKDRWILQEYVEGVDLAVNFVSKSGNFIAWFVQEAISTLGQFGPQMHMRISTERTAAVAAAERVVDALRWEGPGCVDFRIEKRTSQLLCFEINPRFGRAVMLGAMAGANLPLAAAGRPLQNVEAQVTEFEHLSNLYRSPKRFFFPWARDGSKRQTILPEVIRDPVPELMAGVSRIARALHPRGKDATGGSVSK